MLKLGLTGYPVSHSLSPRLHKNALQVMGLAGEYRLYPVPPLPEGAQALGELAQELRAGRLHGLNVTIPHKRAVLSLVDRLSATAQAVGAANTLFLQDGLLVGENTDAPGFLADLTDQTGWAGGLPGAGTCLALVLGAGGSARAVVYALVQAGWQVRVAARRRAQAEELAAALGSFTQPGKIVPLGMSRAELGWNHHDVALLVNATPVGMAPLTAASPWPAGLSLPAAAFVYDLVYNPPATALTAAAKAAGLEAQTGLGMLVEQAALSLEIWTACPVPRQAMWQALLLDEITPGIRRVK